MPACAGKTELEQPTPPKPLSTRVFGEAELRAAVSAVPVIYGLVPLLLLPLIARAYRAELRRMEG